MTTDANANANADAANAAERIASLRARRAGTETPPRIGQRRSPHVAARGRIAASGLAASAVLGLTGTIAAANKATFAESATAQQPAAPSLGSVTSLPAVAHRAVPEPTELVARAIPPVTDAETGSSLVTSSVPGSITVAAAAATSRKPATTSQPGQPADTAPTIAPVPLDSASTDSGVTPVATTITSPPDTTTAVVPTPTTEPPSVPPPPPSPPTTTKPSK